MRRAARIDSNQPEIVAALRRYGCSVAFTHTVGKGFPDLVVGTCSTNLLFEIKNPAGKNKIGESQRDFAATWKGGPVFHAHTVEEALSIIKSVRTVWHAQRSKNITT